MFGKFEIDLFASRLNAKHTKYASWKPDPYATFVDSFLAKWTRFKFYAFPPFSMVMKTVAKVETDVATGVLVCPVWPTQAWYPKLMRMLIDAPLILPLDIISLPFKQEAKHKQKRLRLMACLLSGDAFRVKVFQETLSKSCVRHGEQALGNNTQCALKSGIISVLEGRLIPCRWMKPLS